MENSLETFDLSGKKLKKLHKPSAIESQVTTLILDDNELQRLDNIDSFTKVQKLSAVRNQLLRMHGVCRLHALHTLNLANNGILTIEGLKDLIHLKCLNLAKNNIKTIEHLNTNINLEHLDLSENSITHIVDVSFLKNLKVINSEHIAALFLIKQSVLRGEWLYSQGRGRHFRVGDQQELSQYLASVCPLTGEQLETEEDRKLRLILSKAQHHQQQLREQSETPIPSPMSRKKVYGSRNSPKTNVSRLGNKPKSPDRMATSCYNTSNIMESSILMTQSLDPTILGQSVSSKYSTDTNKDSTTNGVIERCLDDSEVINSPLQALSKLVPVPESLMSPDYRPSPLSSRISIPSTIPTPVSRNNSAKIVQPVKSPKVIRANISKGRSNLIDNKRNSPSPVRSRKIQQINSQNLREKHQEQLPLLSRTLHPALKKSLSSEDESEVCDAKLQSIHSKVEEKRHKEETAVNDNADVKTEKAAICIQKIWRGYYTRNCDKDVQQLYRSLQARRADEYIQKLANDMESTKAALESERKIQMLQMQAINALWKKVSAIQPEGGDAHNTASVSNSTSTTINNTEIVKDLAQTCNVLQNQIQQLQGSMQDIVKFMTIFSQVPGVNQQLKEHATATQTEIVAVHTPQGDAGKMFPFQKQIRPSSLPLPISQKIKKDQANACSNINMELRQFAGSLVDGVIKTVSEERADCLGHHTTEITVTDTARTEEPDTEQTDFVNTLENNI
ncbi:protein phosphatase 1 regulatory subunit sds22-related [Holotrichia oblita]|uniref:Protein phosphatase 1 regulatory subunit sds22-related n=1 Tax=Holotrichia oblita TaxID=644536 RepID=A0ACB9T900_HOLOL|nr:protein phosphatase 1 regulatory subunit sds22-related [Holotrichia oblita]